MQRVSRVIVFMAFVWALAGAVLTGAQDEPVELTVSCRCVEGGLNSNMVTWLQTFVIPTFEEMMAEQGRTVTVSLVEFDGSDEEMKAQHHADLSAGGGADVMTFDGFWIPEFVDAGLLKPLDEIAGETVHEWEGWQHIPESVQALLSFNDDLYGIANGTDVRMLFYRRDLFEEAGLPVPWQPHTWQEILDAGRALKASGVEIPVQLNAGTAMGEATTMQGYFMVLLGAGEHMYDFEQDKWIASSPAILNALRFYDAIYSDEALGVASMQLLEDGRERSFEAFSQGRVGILAEGDFFWRAVLFNEMGVEDRNALVLWAKMPAIEPGAGFRGQDFVTISGGGGWILNPNTVHPDEAWALLSYMADVDAVRAFQLIQPRISFRDDVPVAGDTVMTAMADELLSLSTVRPQLPVYPQISVEVQRMTERVISGEMTPEEAMAQYADAVTALVGEDNVTRMPLE